MIGLPISALIAAAVPYGVEDLSPAHADVREHPVVERHQLFGIAAHPASFLEPFDRSLYQSRQEGAGRESVSLRSIDERARPAGVEASLNHHGISLIGGGERRAM
jgi:hypothetical protein